MENYFMTVIHFFTLTFFVKICFDQMQHVSTYDVTGATMINLSQ